MNYVLLILAFAFSLVGTAQAQDRALQMPDDARMSYIENDEIKVGVDLNHGGAIVYLSREGGANLINNYDLGRQVQLSFFSGPVPYSVPGQEPAEHWRHIGWNPIQTGDDFKTPSRVLAHRNDGKTLYVKCQPMQWPLNNVPGDCTFESWLELAGAVVVARARLVLSAIRAVAHSQASPFPKYPNRSASIRGPFGMGPKAGAHYSMKETSE